ncbi:MAG: spore coat protein [Negativicutes bacterium]|nr:spore coat protein [Negativicutes bacterium]
MVYRNRNTTSSRNGLSDRDMLFDLLASGKSMSHLYDHAIMESSSGMVRDTFETLQHDEHLMAETVFGIMEQEGWYSTGGQREQSSQRAESSQRRSGNLEAKAGSRYMAGRGQSLRSGRAQTRGGSGSQIEWTL